MHEVIKPGIQEKKGEYETRTRRYLRLKKISSNLPSCLNDVCERPFNKVSHFANDFLWITAQFLFLIRPPNILSRLDDS